ncbi:MAG TPA: Rrf2 family transcriptional regulator [Acidisarcina sp.]|nr:Rrf2 family transcriptional regulator [Acidisarcina sp.]
MKLSTKGEYGLLALVDLALQDAAETVQAADIAARQQIPKQYLDQILMILKRAGLVTTLRGRQGGYRLSRPAAKITLLDAVCALEGPLGDDNFVRRNSRKPRPATWAALKSVWDTQNAERAKALRLQTLAEIADACRSSEPEGMYYI